MSTGGTELARPNLPSKSAGTDWRAGVHRGSDAAARIPVSSGLYDVAATETGSRPMFEAAGATGLDRPRPQLGFAAVIAPRALRRTELLARPLACTRSPNRRA